MLGLSQAKSQDIRDNMAQEVNVSARFYYWNEADENNSGGQIVAPVSVVSTLPQENLLFEFGARAALIHSFNDSKDQTGSVTTFSDTVLNVTMTYAGSELPFYPFASVSVNVPTGKETLKGREKNAVMDLDLVEQVRFGEGLNVNLGAGLTVPITNAISATAAASYNFRGSYVPDGDTGFNYDPGNQFVAYGEVVYARDNTYASLGLKFNTEETSRLDGLNYFQPGQFWEVYGTVATQVSQQDVLNASLSLAKYSKNEIFDPFTNQFVTEAAQGAGDVIRVGLGWKHYLDWGSAGLRGEFLYREANDYDALTDRYIPARKRFLIGPEVGVNLNKASSLDLRLQYMRLDEGRFQVTGLERSFDGFWATAMLKAEF